jgi:hypothetical protein
VCPSARLAGRTLLLANSVVLILSILLVFHAALLTTVGRSRVKRPQANANMATVMV